MISSVNQFLSVSGESMKRSAIREILKHLQKPGMISFAGGHPAPEKAIVKNVAFVAGSSFFCNNSGHNRLRINFSFSNEQEIEAGVQRLSHVICDELKCK